MGYWLTSALTNRHLGRPLSWVLAGALAGLLSACSLLTEPKCPEPQYLPFTPADKQWQNFSPGTRWVFRNQRDEQQTYRVAKVQHEEKQPYGTAVFVERTDYYLDYWYMTWVADTANAPAGSLFMKRMPPDYQHATSYLYCEASWKDFLGYLDFGPDLATATFSNLIVRGVTYNHAKSFKVSDSAIADAIRRGSTQQTKQVDYDQQVGVIRFVTLNGDVWERVP